MRDLEAGRRAHLNMVEAFASLPPHQPRGFLRRSNGVVVAATASPVALFNEVLPVADPVSVEALVAAVQGLQATGLPFYAQLREGLDDGLVRAVTDLGLEEDASASWPAMVCTDLPRVAEGPGSLHIRTVDGRSGLEEFVRASAEITGGSPEITHTWLGHGVADDPRWALLTGYAAGVPVAQAMSFRSGRVVGIYNVVTAATARRRGYGWAVTSGAIATGAQAGCTEAVLQSSAVALPMYESHGFSTLFRYRAFRWRASRAPRTAR
ncbi:GNAT family N-acetyltransferase [Ornithinicoccus halotolerans]|uniref:GNAT family N-acetyltransferase n=1 Tax=Ornithinicoccus halotolerans TaxID=1748220 RepID=UPI001294BD28|nr:GNAT family N-acetyltransferase [Ornithinicoccus halotolerans]